VQQQYINLAVGGAILAGGVPAMKEFYNVAKNPVYSVPTLEAGQFKIQDLMHEAYLDQKLV
jgi:uncharacterized pyridoxamine 5'-phosphate oxidase family protein